MMRLQVLVNGRLICTAGREIGGSLHAEVRMDPPIAALIWESGVKRVGYPLGAKVIGDCELEVMAHHESGGEHKHLGWANIKLMPGDEVTIRVLGPGESDPPVTKQLHEDIAY
jgi:hypothetical protein